jgi:hypothetical protein
MPSGSRKGKLRAADLQLDPKEIQEEIRRNRESNERFLREYSAWFERQGRSKKRKSA